MACIWLHVADDEKWCDQDHDEIDCKDCPDYKSFQDVVATFFNRER